MVDGEETFCRRVVGRPRLILQAFVYVGLGAWLSILGILVPMLMIYLDAPNSGFGFLAPGGAIPVNFSAFADVNDR